jgi:hypothetical protein
LAGRAVKRGPPAYRERDNSSGDEQLWQREVGNAMPVLAMAWVLSVTMFTVRLSKQAAVWRNAVALSWSALGLLTTSVRAPVEVTDPKIHDQHVLRQRAEAL